MTTTLRHRLLGFAVAVVTMAAGGAGMAVRAEDDVVRYVALGDSYTAGPFIPMQRGDPPGCRRSDHNYPSLVARSTGMVLRDVSCSGATTADLFAPQSIPGGTNAAQLESVDRTAGVVTVGIGGNDIGFGSIVQSCIAVVPLGQPCQDLFAGPDGDEVARRIAETAPKVAAVLGEVRRRAPAARVFVVGYPAILPEYGPGCWPVMPFAPADVPYLRDKAKQLNAMVAAQAAAAGAVFVDTYGPATGHDTCAPPLIRWVEPVVPLFPAAPVHPNALGMAGMAEVVAAAVRGAAAPVPAPVVGIEAGISIELGR